MSRKNLDLNSLLGSDKCVGAKKKFKLGSKLYSNQLITAWMTFIRHQQVLLRQKIQNMN